MASRRKLGTIEVFAAAPKPQKVDLFLETEFDGSVKILACDKEGNPFPPFEPDTGMPYGQLSTRQPAYASGQRKIPNDCFAVHWWGANVQLAKAAEASGLFELTKIRPVDIRGIKAPVWRVKGLAVSEPPAPTRAKATTAPTKTPPAAGTPVRRPSKGS